MIDAVLLKRGDQKGVLQHLLGPTSAASYADFGHVDVGQLVAVVVGKVVYVLDGGHKRRQLGIIVTGAECREVDNVLVQHQGRRRKCRTGDVRLRQHEPHQMLLE